MRISFRFQVPGELRLDDSRCGLFYFGLIKKIYNLTDNNIKAQLCGSAPRTGNQDGTQTMWLKPSWPPFPYQLSSHAQLKVNICCLIVISYGYFLFKGHLLGFSDHMGKKAFGKRLLLIFHMSRIVFSDPFSPSSHKFGL